MPIFSPSSGFYEAPIFTRRRIFLLLAGSLAAVTPFIVWPRIGQFVLTTNYLPHFYCYLRSPGLIWTHVIADALIAIAYLAISVNLGYLVSREESGIPFHWMFLAFGLFIIACGATHFMEVVTIWVPVYVLSAAVKIVTAGTSLTTAVALPFITPKIIGMAEQAKVSERVTAELRASEERKEALLREVHHRVKNNLAMICSLFYLQSTHTKDEQITIIFREMENRVHSMALVHERLNGSENLARIDFAEYAKILAEDILSSYGSPSTAIRLTTELEPVILGVDAALSCGLILNELISNAIKHGFRNRSEGEIKLLLRASPEGRCTLCIQDDGSGVAGELSAGECKTLGLRLVRSLAQQVDGSFELFALERGTSATLRFKVDNHAR